MQIWVDADACPNIIKDILFRAANRTKTNIILVANQQVRCVPSPYIRQVQVPGGFDVADNYIVQNLSAGDLVITADIPLADEVIAKDASALNPRGEFYSKNNIKQRLSIRNLSESLRSSGMITGGPPKLSKSQIQDFANCLDQWLHKNTK